MLDIALNIDLYKKLYLIRKASEEICKYYPEDEMKTPVHLSMGEEAIAVGVIHALKPQDQFLGTYRSHGIYLARTMETDSFFAELYGKITGLARGKSGSMHLSDPEAGFLGTSAIVGGIIPVAVGAAYANKQMNKGNIVAVFLGDGATEEGVFWESLNIACLMKLPILFVCEDNELAALTHQSARQGFKSILPIISQFECSVFSDSTTDVESIYNLANKAIDLIVKDERPCFLCLRYYRYLEHVGIYEDFHCNYRSKDEFEEWYKKDSIKLQRKKLLELGCVEEDIQKIEANINSQIENSIKLAKEAPFPESEELYKEIYL